MEYEQFMAKVRNSGGTTLEITIPMLICQYAGIEEGDFVKVMLKKVKELSSDSEDAEQ
ncbi:MAG: hypothetical protein ACOYWZ_01110 [Bacillota bacterium]